MKNLTLTLKKCIKSKYKQLLCLVVRSSKLWSPAWLCVDAEHKSCIALYSVYGCNYMASGMDGEAL